MGMSNGETARDTHEFYVEAFGEDEKKILTLSGNWEYGFMRQFARLNSDWHGMAWHWYPLGAGKSDDVIPNVNNPEFTNTIVRERLEEILFWRDRDVPDAELWMGETGGAFNSGQNTTTNTFMSHRWYLDQLGMFAKYGHSAYCRQTLIGGNYGLLQREGDGITVNPDFYGTMLFHHLMGDVVKNVKIQVDEGVAAENLHVYSHTSGSTGYTGVLIINFDRENDFSLKEIDGKEFENIRTWVMTAEDDQDKNVFVNGMKLEVDKTIPNVMEMGETKSLPITIPSKSYAFLSFRPF